MAYQCQSQPALYVGVFVTICPDVWSKDNVLYGIADQTCKCCDGCLMLCDASQVICDSARRRHCNACGDEAHDTQSDMVPDVVC